MDQHTTSCCSVSRSHSKTDRKIDIQNEEHQADTSDMVYIQGGDFLMGSNSSEASLQDGEKPVRQIKLDPFFMDPYAVTNAEFDTFVKDTNYKTDAEAYGWSFVFYQFLNRPTTCQSVPQTPWWKVVEGAYWYQPEGENSDISKRLDHPVVHISWNDALAYCKWAGKRLPTEAEWEIAARGGLKQKEYPWGDELSPNGKHMCNIWQGTFPDKNTIEDCYIGTCPVDAFPSNHYGLYNLAGNVWEWCYDWFTPSMKQFDGDDNPAGPSSGTGKVMKGGSYLCHASYCNRYRVSARSSNTIDSSTGNLGFRCVVSS